MARNDPSWKGGRDDPAVRHLLCLREKCKERNIPEDIISDIDEIYSLINKRNDYCEDVTSPPSAELQNIIEVSDVHPWKRLYEDGTMKWKCYNGMLSGNMESQFLRSLVSMTNAKKVLELGMFTGLGALAMAESLPADGIVYTCELQPYLQEMARGLVDKSPHGKKIIIKGAAKEALLELAEKEEKVDLVFMDCNKEGYLECLKILMDRGVLAPKGTVIVDNALLKGHPYAEINEAEFSSTSPGAIAIRKFNDVVAKDSSLHKVLLPMKDGIMIVRRLADVEGSV